MFKKLKEKIAEEVKPLKIPQFAQSVVSPGSNAFVEPPPNDAFSLDDELPEDVLGNEGFSVVDLHHPSQPIPLSSGRFSRQSSMSSLASDASAFLPIHDTSLGAFNMQDMESASEREDILPQMNTISKQELCNSYLKLYRHYQKYKGRTADLKSFCVELEKDNKKLKTVLLECQEKSLRRMAELKEQCALEQHAKAHLEEALRNDLEEKDHLIQTLQTKIRLLKDAHAASSSVIHAEFKNLHQLQGDIGDEEAANIVNSFQAHQKQKTDLVQENSHTWKKVFEESEIEAFKERIDFFEQQIFADSNVDMENDSLKSQLKDFLNYISSSFINRTSLLSHVLSSEQEKLSEQENLHENKIVRQSLPEISEKNEKDGIQAIGSRSYSSISRPDVNLQSVLVNTNDTHTVVPDTLTCEILATSVKESQTENAWETCSCKNREIETKTVNFEKVAQELEASHQTISRQDSVISELQRKLSSLQKEAEETSNHKKKITETIDALKSELVKTKLDLEEFQQQCVSAQCTIEEKEKIAKEATDNLIQINEKLDKACADKTCMNEVITNIESELKETKDTCKQLTQVIQNAKSVIEGKDSLIEHMKKELSQALENLEFANVQKNESNEMVTSLKRELEEMVLKFQHVNNECLCISKVVEEKDSTITDLKRELNALREDLEIVSSEKINATSLQKEIKTIKVDYEEIFTKFQSAQELVKEKDLQIIKINDELSTFTHKLEEALKEKTEQDKIVGKLQSDLDGANLQIQHVTQDLLSAQKSVDVKDSDIVKITEEMTNVQMELRTVLSQKSELEQTLQKELSDAHCQLEELTQNLQVANKLVEEKECELARVRGNIASVQGELNLQISSNIEKCKEVKVLQNDLMEAKENFEKVRKELEASHELINETNFTKELINKDLDIVRKNLKEMTFEKTEAKEISNTLRNEVTNINVRLEQMTEDLKSAQKLVQEKDENSVKLSEELSVIQKNIKRIESEKDEALEKVTAFQNEMLDVTAKLVCAHKLIEEKDKQIACLNTEVASICEIDSNTQQKQETNEKVNSLQNELTNLHLEFEQVTGQLNSAEHVIKEKEFAIAHVTERLTNVCKELDAAVIHNTELTSAMEILQYELKEMKLKCNLFSKEIEEAHQLIEGKDFKIAHLTENLSKMSEELHTISVLKSETSETLQEELHNSKNVCDKITQDLESAHKLLSEKNILEDELKEELGRVKEELVLMSTQQCQASENISNLQHELTTTKLRLETTTQELQSANQLLGGKQLMKDKMTENLDANSTSFNGDNALIASLQSELTTNNFQLEKLKQELECAQIIIEEKDSFIREMREELTDYYKKLDGNSFHGTDISSTVENKGLESTFYLQSHEHDSVSSASVSQSDLPRAIFRNKGSENDGEWYGGSTRREFLSDHSDQTEYDRTLEKEIRKGAKESSSLVATTTQEEGSVVECGSFPASDKAGITSQILNTSKVSHDSEEHSPVVTTSSSECREDNRIPQNKNCFEDTYLLSQSVQQLEELASNRNFPVPILKRDHTDKNKINPIQDTNIQSILEEIQKENKEYGSLLECHKNIINHLERITKMQTEGMQPGSAEWLHKQLILLSQKLYDTKEKQRIQIASINNFVKHQEDLKRADVNENHMTIEMQYLRNIVFQYMIGKETMLLAKVISAVMKFDQQQMDQVMQKELQKQTLLGQLGLL